MGDFSTPVTPVASTVEASDVSISNEAESQMERGEINVVLLFSILSTHDLKKTKNSLIEDGLTENLSMAVSLAWEHGSPTNYVEKKFIVVDCSHLAFDSVTGQTITLCDMQDCLEDGINQVKSFLDEEIVKYDGGKIHFTLGGFMPIDALPFAFAAVLKRSLPNESVYDVFVNSAKENFSFAEYEEKKWKLVVDYACLYEVFSLYFERKLYANEIKQMMRAIENKLYDFAETGQLPEKDLENGVAPTEILYGQWIYSYEWLKEYYPVRKEEEQLWIEYQKAIAHAAKVERGEVKPWFPITGMEAVHKFLGITSIAFSPISLVDAAIHAAEWVVEGDENNAHKISIGIDLVCCIPFVRAGRVIATGGKMTALGVARGCKLLMYRGQRLIVRMDKGITQAGRRRLAKNAVKAKKKQQQAVKTAEKASDKLEQTNEQLQKLQPFIKHAETGELASSRIINEMKQNLFHSGTIFVDNFKKYMNTLKAAQSYFKRNSAKLEQLRARQKELEKLAENQQAASRYANQQAIQTTISTQSYINHATFTMHQATAKYRALAKEEFKITKEIKKLEKANSDMWAEAIKPWTQGQVLADAKQIFKEWFKPLSLKKTFNDIKGGGLDAAIATEGALQTVLGGVETFTGIPSDMVKLFLDDGTVTWTSETAIELGVSIETIRAKYGYEKGENTYNPYANGSLRPKVNNPSDLYN